MLFDGYALTSSLTLLLYFSLDKVTLQDVGIYYMDRKTYSVGKIKHIETSLYGSTGVY